MRGGRVDESGARMAEVQPIIPADVVYTRTAITLHWLTLLLIATGFSLGRWMVDLPIAPQTLRIYAYHKWIGITVFLVTLVRVAWRLAHPVPPPAGLPNWRRRAAAASHASLYVLMLTIPLSGWLYSSASGVQVVYLGVVPLPNLVAKDHALAALLKSVHFTLNFTLLALVLVHAGAALRHHLVDRDHVLVRMLPVLAGRDKESSR
jgi:cytochrome b561